MGNNEYEEHFSIKLFPKQNKIIVSMKHFIKRYKYTMLLKCIKYHFSSVKCQHLNIAWDKPLIMSLLCLIFFTFLQYHISPRSRSYLVWENQNNLDNLKYLVTIIIVYWCTNIVQAGVQHDIIRFIAIEQGTNTI